MASGRTLFTRTVHCTVWKVWGATAKGSNWVTCVTASRRLQSQNSGGTEQNVQPFDETMLQHLVCPLSKKNLRYDKDKEELVCDELGVAYPVVNGIPNLVPQDARMLKQDSQDSTKR